MDRSFSTLGAVDIQRVDTDASNLGINEYLGGLFAEVRVVDEVGVGVPVSGVRGMNQHCMSCESDEIIGVEFDGSLSSTVETHRRHRCDTLEWEFGEIVAISKCVERYVEVRAGVGTHGHQPDLERDPWPVDGFGRIA